MIKMSREERTVLKNFTPSSPKTANNIIHFGETYPDPEYHINRGPEDHRRHILWYGTGVFVLEYVKSGVGHIKSCGKEYTVRGGDCYFLIPGERHEYYSDKNDPFNKIFITFSGSLFPAMMKSLHIDESVRVFRKNALADFEEMERLINSDIPRSEAFDAITAIIVKLLLNLKPEPRTEPDSRLALMIRQLLDENAAKNVSLSDICSQLYISKNYLICLFRKEYGITPHRYLSECRLERAKAMLTDSDRPVSAIALELGFETEKYFFGFFKRYIGCTPGEFRKSTKKDS